MSSSASALQRTKINVNAAIKWIYSVDKSSCLYFHSQDLILKEDVSWGAPKFFENEAIMALRLANFISAFLQISDSNDVHSADGWNTDRPLTEDQMIAETLSIVMSNVKVWSAGIYWEPKKFADRTLFAPFAYKSELTVRKFKVEDLARFNESQEMYTERPWYRSVKQRWSKANLDELQKHYLKIKRRFNESGEFGVKHEQYPFVYRASDLSSGHWSTPYFDCHGLVKRWLITYAVPFFGWDNLKDKLEFKYVYESLLFSFFVQSICKSFYALLRGAVAISVDMLQMDINQCDDEPSDSNVFKGTHKCDRSTTYVSSFVHRSKLLF